MQAPRPSCRSTVGRKRPNGKCSDPAPSPAVDAVAWANAHLSERAAVFSRADLFAAALAHAPGAVTIEEAERAVAALERDGALHAVNVPGAEDSLATDRTVGEERETIACMRGGLGRGRALMRGWEVQDTSTRGRSRPARRRP